MNRRRREDDVETVTILLSGEVFELEENLRQALAGFAQGRSILPAQAARASVAVSLAAERSWAEGKPILLEVLGAAAERASNGRSSRRHQTIGRVSRRIRIGKVLFTRGLLVGNAVHLLAKLRQCEIHALAGTALIAERAVLRHAMPGVDLDPPGKRELRRRIKCLPWDMNRCGRDIRRPSL